MAASIHYCSSTGEAPTSSGDSFSSFPGTSSSSSDNTTSFYSGYSFSGDIASSRSGEIFPRSTRPLPPTTQLSFTPAMTLLSLLFPSPSPTPILSLLRTLQLYGRTMWLLVWLCRWTTPTHTVIAASSTIADSVFSRDLPRVGTFMPKISMMVLSGWCDIWALMES